MKQGLEFASPRPSPVLLENVKNVIVWFTAEQCDELGQIGLLDRLKPLVFSG
jgi:hypothetical protein